MNGSGWRMEADPMIRMESCGKTDVGLSRPNNEDAFVSAPDRSGGLTDMVVDLLIEERLTADFSLEEKVECLVRDACEAGGYDNVTVVLGRVLQVEGRMKSQRGDGAG